MKCMFFYYCFYLKYSSLKSILMNFHQEKKEDVERKRHHHDHHHHPCKNEDDKLSMDSLPPVYQTNNPTPAESDSSSTLGKVRKYLNRNLFAFRKTQLARIFDCMVHD